MCEVSLTEPDGNSSPISRFVSMNSANKSSVSGRTFTSSIFINVGGSLGRSVTDDQNNADVQVDSVSKKLTKDKKSGKEKEKVPEFIVKPRRQFVNEGQTAKFKASYDGTPQTKLTWTRTDEEPLSSGGRHKIYEDGEFHWLEVCDVTSEDSGSYTCTIMNAAGSNQATTDLDVYVKPKTSSKKSGFVAPKVDIPLNDLVVSPGDKNVSMECKFSNAIDASATWYKDGRLLTAGFLSKQSFDGRLARLVLTRVASKDSGKYQCVVTNTGGEAKTDASLTVSTAGIRAIPPKFVNPLSNQSLCVGDKLVLEAKVTGYPRPTVHWYKEKEEITSTETRTIEFDGSTVRLVMTHVQVTDSATYKCVAENEAGKDQIKAKITVTATTKDQSTDEFREPPTFVKELHDMEVDNGDRVELSVEVKGMTNTDVIWLHGDTEISTSDPFVKIVSHGNVHELHLPQTSETDSGVYACVLQNVCGRVHTYCNLCVKECKIDNQIRQGQLFSPMNITSEQINENSQHTNNNEEILSNGSEQNKPLTNSTDDIVLCDKKDLRPPGFLLRPRTAFVDVGKSAIFLCRTFGVPPPSVEWSREGEIIPNQGRYKVKTGEDCTLEVKGVLESDVGTYTCTLRNPCGTSATDTRLVLSTQDVPRHTPTHSQNPSSHVLKKISHLENPSAKLSSMKPKETKPEFSKVRLRKMEKPTSKFTESTPKVSDTRTLPSQFPKRTRTPEETSYFVQTKRSEESKLLQQQHRQSDESSESDNSDMGTNRGQRAGAAPGRLNFVNSTPKVRLDKRDTSAVNPAKTGANQIDFRNMLQTQTRHQVSTPVKDPITRSVTKPVDRPLTSSITNLKSPSTLNGTKSATRSVPERKVSKVSDYVTALERAPESPSARGNVQPIKSKFTPTKTDEPIKSKLTTGKVSESISTKFTPKKKEDLFKSYEPIKSKFTSGNESINTKLSPDKKDDTFKSKLTPSRTVEPMKSKDTPPKMEEPVKSKFTSSKLEQPINEPVTKVVESKKDGASAALKIPPPVPPKTKRQTKIDKKWDEVNEISESILSMPGGPPMKELMAMIDDEESSSVATEDSFADSESSQPYNATPAWVKDHFDQNPNTRINTPSSGFSSLKSINSSENFLDLCPSESDDSTVQSESNDSGIQIVRATPAVPYTPITLKNPRNKSKDATATSQMSDVSEKSEKSQTSEPDTVRITKLEFEGPTSTSVENKTTSAAIVVNGVNSRRMSTESDKSKRIPSSPEHKEIRLVRSRSVDKVSNQHPSFLSNLESKSIPEGRCITFECQVTGIPRPEVSWFMNNNKIKPSKFFQMTYVEDTARLVITGAYPEDDGEYLCVASNVVGTERQSCYLHIKDCHAISTEEEDASETSGQQAPHIHEISPPNLTVLRGKQAMVQVSFTAEPRPNITWLLNKTRVTMGDRYTINTTEHLSRLVINDVTLGDAGIYDIDVVNDVGRDSGSMAITVEDVPDVPIGKPYASEVALNYVILSWSGPAFDGGSLITNYRVEICEAEYEIWSTLTEKCHSTSYHAANLKPHNPYFFRVSAENKHGMSNPSETSDVVVTKDRRASERLSIESDEVFLSSTSTASVSPFTPLSPQEEEPEIPFSPRVVSVQKEKVFEDLYDLQKEVGKGKFGNVHLCVEKTDPDTKWAAKIIKCRGTDKEMVQREIEIMNQLVHPKLLMLRNAFETARKMVLVMEYVGGGELFERVVDEDFDLTERDSVHFLRQICEGVDYMHGKSIVHLDLKPENILCVRKDSNLIKIIDFGLAQFHKPGESLRTISGTPEFIAPEVVNYDEIGFQTDVWSLGVICYVLLSGLSPFMGDNDSETLSNVTRGDFDFDDEAFEEISFHAKDFIEKTLHLNRRKRPNVKDCLKHKWLVKQQNSAKKLRQSLRNLKQFMARRKWQKMGTAIRALGRMSSLQKLQVNRGDRANSESSVFSDSDSNSHSDLSSQNPRSTSSTKLDDLPDLNIQMAATATSNTTENENVFNLQQQQNPTPAEENKDISPTTDYCNNCIKGQNQESDLLNESTSTSRTLSAQSDTDTSENASMRFVRKMVDCQAFTGDVVRFDITVLSEHDQDIHWYQEDVEIVEDDRHSFVYNNTGECSLIIKNVSEEDDGEFTCKASNCFGEISCSAEIIICGTGAF